MSRANRLRISVVDSLVLSEPGRPSVFVGLVLPIPPSPVLMRACARVRLGIVSGDISGASIGNKSDYHLVFCVFVHRLRVGQQWLWRIRTRR